MNDQSPHPELQTTVSEQTSTPQPIEQLPSKKSNPSLMIIIVLGIIILIGTVVAFFAGKSSAPQATVEVSPSVTAVTTTTAKPTSSIASTSSAIATFKPNAKQTPNISLKSGFSFRIPAGWSAKISSQTDTYFSGKFTPQGAGADTTFIELESQASAKVSKNPLLTLSKVTTENNNNVTKEVSEGTEKFEKSQRKVKQVVIKNKTNTLIATLYNPTLQQTVEFDTFIDSVSSPQSQANKSFLKISEVFAAESIAGVAEEKYQSIQVMGNPLPERITKSEPVFKDGYGKFYSFSAFKGQRLTTVAMEDNEQNEQYRSFLRSEVYSEDGKLINSGDTRIQFEAPYTGKYYYIVHSFENREGGFLLKVFDRNQTENLLYLKYDDGSERLVESNKNPPNYGAKSVALIMQFINPVEVLDTSVRFFATPKEFEQGSGLITVPITLYSKDGTYQEDLVNGTHLPEDDANNKLGIKITKLSGSKLLIESSEGSLFPPNKHYNLLLTVPVSNGALSFGGGRFFTNN